jgi:hypothetical protein
MGREAALARQREYRKLNNNASTRKYEKTRKVFLMRAYRNMEWVTHSENSRRGSKSRHNKETV